MIKKLILIFSILLLLLSCSSSILYDPTTVIKYSLPQNSYVKLTVENSYNTIISVLVDREMDAGAHEVAFDASNLVEGVYYYTIRVESTGGDLYYEKTRTLLLVKP